MSNLAIQLPAYEDQTERNLQRWEELLADPFYATLNHRIETDRHGHILMTPPPGNSHSTRQSEISFLLRTLLPLGKTQVEAPVSTSDGVKGCDVTWASLARYEEIYDPRAHRGAPEICIEVLSPSNTREEMSDKKALYFDTGAKEVWFCHEDGRMEFHLDANRPAQDGSLLCPEFPGTIDP